MIQPNSIVKIADNSGAKIGRVFKILGSSKKRYARIGELVKFSVQKAEPRKEIKKKAVLLGMVIRQKTPLRRKDGSYIRFDENALVVVDKKKGEITPRAGRIFGPIPREIAEAGHQAIISLASEVI
ncbi:MAG: 50S ribosomal protein L14 [Candidatus Zambryskibacteria bacterium]|nr:50S ribosomal protein L14 [Candidatus Zambryskibacteria bacterium]